VGHHRPRQARSESSGDWIGGRDDRCCCCAFLGRPVLTYAAFSNHFIAVRADPVARAIQFKDSLGDYDSQERADVLDSYRRFFGFVWGVPSGCIAVSASPCPMQSECDCGIHTINNILQWAGVFPHFVPFDRSALTKFFDDVLVPIALASAAPHEPPPA
jgi:hypothetical protein